MYNNIKLPKYNELLYLAQLGLIWVYLFINMALIGDFGAALEVLAVFFLVGFLSLFCQMYSGKIYISRYFVAFLLFNLWVCIRFLIDYQDYAVLREYTIGTTGGILLFYMIGLILNQAMNFNKIRLGLYFLPISFMYFIFAYWLYVKLSDRMLTDLFLIDDPDGAYQRPGNFMSISFIIYSFLYCKYIIENNLAHLRNIRIMISTIIYCSIAMMMLALSQLIGSNSASAVILIFITSSVILYFILIRGGVENLYNKIYKNGQIKYTHLAYQISISFLMVLMLVMLLIVPSLFYLDLDLTQTRIFGFGNYDSTSFSSRADIFKVWGVDQMTYAPIFGNAKVAYYVTGDAGASLHNFLPSALSSLGLIGVTLILYIFYCVMKVLLLRFRVRITDPRDQLYAGNILYIHISISFFFLFAFANLTVDYSWIVLWFSLGLYFNAFGFKKSDIAIGKNSK